MTVHRLCILSSFIVAVPASAMANDTDVPGHDPSEVSTAHLGLGAVVSNLDAGAELRLRADLSRAVRVGARIRGLAVRETYIAGFEENEGGAIEGLATASLRLARFGRAALRLRIGAGARASFVDSDREEQSTRLLTELGPMVHWPVDASVTLRFGWIQRTDLEVSPTTDIAVLGPIFRAGARVRLTPHLSAYGEAELGGVLGYGGDNEKIQARGVVGLQLAFGGSRLAEPAAKTTPAPTIGAFVSLEWRAMYIGRHLSHGPGLSAGVRLWDGLLRVGLSGFGRPGPINPETFEVTPANNQIYRGQDRLSLRSDGGMFGLLIESELPVLRAQPFVIIPSVSLGNAAFGFYLTGDDRNTPDGRRVSAWEDELQDGKDAGVGFAVEPGVRIAWRRPGALMAPYVAFRYLFVLGYDAFAKDSYDGPSLGAGIELVF